MPLPPLSGGLFVGRDHELARLSELVGLGASTRPGLVVLSGDAGIGKTRLVAELAARAAEHGWQVLVGHCLGEAGSTLPYLPFTEMLGRLQGARREEVDLLLEEHPHLARLLPGRRTTGSGVGGDALERGDLVEAVHACLEHLAAQGPVLAVVEDVHWADQSSRDLLSLLFTRGFEGPVSLVATYRSDDLHRRHPLRPALAHWSRLAQVERLDLQPLPDKDVRDLVRALSPAPLAEEEIQAVVDRAEGNAFFAEELVAAGRLGRAGPAEDLSRLLLVRFEQLGASAQHVARLAAVAGRQVSHRLLLLLADLSALELDEALRDAVEHHVLVPTESGYAFRHALLAETVYDDLLPGERVRAHQRFADALVADPGLGTWSDLARHALAGGDRERARTASVCAGDAAMAVGGPEEAFRHFEQALSLMPADHDDLDTVTLRAASAATAAGRAEKALHLIENRLERLATDTPPERRAELLTSLALTARLTEADRDTLAATKEALDLVPAGTRGALRARLLFAHMQALADRSREEEAITTGEEAIALAESLGLREVASEARTVLARLVEQGGDPEQSRRSLERVVAETRAAGDPAEIRALHHLGALHHRAGRLAEAIGHYRQGAERARQLGRAWAPYGFDARLLAAIAAYEAGEWDLATELLDLHGEAAPQPARALLESAGLYVAAGRGQSSAAAVLERVRPHWRSDGLVPVIAASAAIDLLGDAGDLAGAVAVHDDAVSLLSALWGDRFQAQLRFSALLLGQLATRAGSAGTAERGDLLERGRLLAATAASVWERSVRRGHGGPESRAWEARSRAEWLRLQWLAGAGDVDLHALESAWREAVDAFAAYGHAFETARSRARLAAALRAAGELRGSADLVRAALATAEELGARPLVQELRELGGRSQPAPTAGARAADALTPREREILDLVALGRSNGQIGTQLFISAKTASVHVSNILAKLGAAGRGEAVAIARERGLLDR